MRLEDTAPEEGQAGTGVWRCFLRAELHQVGWSVGRLGVVLPGLEAFTFQ